MHTPGGNAHPVPRTEGAAMNTAINTSTALQSLSISQRLIAGVLALMLGLTLLVGAGFAGDYRLHNGAHDTRHAMGFPCH
jgi:cobalt transporter subunit CbtB